MNHATFKNLLRYNEKHSVSHLTRFARRVCLKRVCYRVKTNQIKNIILYQSILSQMQNHRYFRLKWFMAKKRHNDLCILDLRLKTLLFLPEVEAFVCMLFTLFSVIVLPTFSFAFIGTFCLFSSISLFCCFILGYWSKLNCTFVCTNVRRS